MNTSLRQLALLVDGKCEADGDILIHHARPLRDANAESITFIESARHLESLKHSAAIAVVAPPGIETCGKATIRVTDPLSSFIKIVEALHGRANRPCEGINPRADVHPEAVIGENCSIHAFATVGAGTTIGRDCRVFPGVVIGRDCRLGDGVTLHPNVVLYDGTIVGDRVTVHANSVLGADGFGYRFQEGKHEKIPQLGFVEIGDDVEIGACTTIDSGTFHATRIGAGTKIDNLVQVAHNCQIGKHNLFIAQTGIAGSSSTGDFVVVAGQAGIIDHVHIGDGATIGGRAAVTKDVPDGLRMLGSPATPERDQKRIMMSMRLLPEMRKELLRIKQHLGLIDQNQPRKTG